MFNNVQVAMLFDIIVDQGLFVYGSTNYFYLMVSQSKSLIDLPFTHIDQCLNSQVI